VSECQATWVDCFQSKAGQHAQSKLIFHQKCAIHFSNFLN